MAFKNKRNHFRETLKDYLSFSRQERKSLFAVALILFLLAVAKLSIEYWPQGNAAADAVKFDKEMNNFLASKKTGSDSSVIEKQHLSHSAFAGYPADKEKAAAELFNFNPNGLPEADWKRLGFSDKQIHVIKNYEAKGGRFCSKEDVRKMYSVSTEDYDRIEAYIVIPPKEESQHKNTYENKFPSKVYANDFKVDIGTADTTELKKLRGIGTSYANRIVKYRTKLGGFYSVSQLHEVWGLNDSLFNTIADHVYIGDSSNLARININTATFNELKAHPYFSYKFANTLINYRIQHGSFKAIAELKKMPLVDDSIYRKIAPYLKIE